LSSALRSSSPQLPIQTRSPAFFGGGSGLEDAGVGGFVPGPDAEFGTLLSIHFAENFAESEDAVVMLQIVSGHAGGIADHAMMRVVEEQREVVRGAVFADLAHQIMIVPFVDDHQVGVFEGCGDVEVLLVVDVALQFGIDRAEFTNWLLAVFGNEILTAP
jgi:hypothetical protein